MDTIHIENIRVRGILGINDWERDKTQDIVINVKISFDGSKAAQSDDIKDTIDYKKITKDIINLTETSSYFLIEKLTEEILTLILKEELAQKATVRVDKPHALRFADSVAVERTKSK